MIHNEKWYREAVRPIRLDPQLVDAAVNSMLWDLADEARTTPKWATNYSFGKASLLFKNVKGEHTSVELIWIPVEEGSSGGFLKGAFYGLSMDDGTLSKDGGNLLIAIKFNALKTPEEVCETLKGKRSLETLKNQIKSYLQHELTHAMDVYPEGAHLNYIGPGEDPEGYLNSSREVRAFMQEISQETYQEAEELGDSLFWWYETSGDLFKRLLHSSKTWRNLQSRWTPENRKLILRGAWNFLQDRGVWEAWKQSRQKYLQEGE